jgi:CheY-like chemotaxis protein
MATILLIEDNIRNAHLTMKVLSHYGYEIIHAQTAIDGLREAQLHPPDLILLDLDLPDLDGKAVANRLRQMPSMCKIPIVALTANTAPTTKRLAMAFGCNGFLTKPIDTREFPNQVAAFIKVAVVDSHPI